MAHKDPEVRRLYWNEWHKRNRRENNRKIQSLRRDRILKKRTILARYKRIVGCRYCGYSRNSSALEFHHVGEKTETISRMVSGDVGWNRIKEEVRKCLVLCSNCHREIHA